MKKFLLILLAIVAVAVCAVGVTFGPVLKGATSMTKLDEGLYYFEFSGDDGFDSLLASGGAASPQQLAGKIIEFLSHGFVKMPAGEPVEEAYGCSALAVDSPDGERLVGRNFDWNSATGLIAKVHPKGGYSYISAFNAEFLGFGDDWNPEEMAGKVAALAGIFVALDGVNEKGLAIADLTAGQGEETHQNNGNPDLTTTCAIKYLLKTASSVDEALELLKGIDMHSDVGCLHHLAMSDPSGKSVVVEYVGEKMVVTPADVVTNHYLCSEAFGYGKVEGDCRYEKIEAVRDSLGGVMNSDQLLDAMTVAWQAWGDGTTVNGGTQWTALFNLTDRSVDYIWQRDPSRRFHFSLSE